MSPMVSSCLWTFVGMVVGLIIVVIAIKIMDKLGKL